MTPRAAAGTWAIFDARGAVYLDVGHASREAAEEELGALLAPYAVDSRWHRELRVERVRAHPGEP